MGNKMQIEINDDITDQIVLQALRNARRMVIEENTAIWSFNPAEETRQKAYFLNSISEVIDWFKAY